jgi:ferredoxin
MYINPDECIECGACEWVCPVNAISLDVDLPEDKAELTDLTREWVTEHSVVGGAGKRGVVGIDRPDVAALPAKPPAD